MSSYTRFATLLCTAVLGLSLGLAACGGPDMELGDDPMDESALEIATDANGLSLRNMLTGTTGCTCAGQTAPECGPGTLQSGTTCSLVNGTCTLQSTCTSFPNPWECGSWGYPCP